MLMLLRSLAKASLGRPAPGRRLGAFFGAALGGALVLSAIGAEPAEQVDFNFQIRPVLADRCFKCHGPDEKARKAKLRLDQPESAYAVREKDSHGPAIVPHHP